MNETQPSADTAAKSRHAAMLTVFLVVFIDLLGFGIVLPILPRYADEFLSGYDAWSRGAILGVLYSSFSLMQFLFSPVWGRLSDRIGRRPVLLISLAGSVAFYGLFAVASNLSPDQGTLAILLFLLSRIGAGIAGASVSTAAAVISDCTPKEKRSKSMALIGVAFGFGFTFGPLIAYFGMQLFQSQPWAPGAIAAGLSLIAWLIAATIFKETRTTGSPLAAKELFSVRRTIEIVRNPALGPGIFVYFLAIFAFANFEATLSLYTKAVFGMANDSNLLIFAYIGGVLILAQGGVYRRLAGKVSDASLLTIGILLMGLGLAGIGGVAWSAYMMTGSDDAVAGLKPAFYLTTAVAVFGFAFTNPSIAALISKRADPTRQGEVQGVNQAFASLGRILGPFLGLLAFEQHPSRSMPYLLALAALALVVLLMPMVRRNPGEAPAGTA